MNMGLLAGPRRGWYGPPMVPEPRAASGPAVAGGDAAAPPVLSVVIPVRNEAPNIAPLVAEIEAARRAAGLSSLEPSST